MAKRGAPVQLTDRNWQEEDEEPDEPGHFKQAAREEINKRVIKKAKRRVDGSETSGGFTGFQGFGSPIPSSAPSPLTTTFTGFKGYGNSSTIVENNVNDSKPMNGMKLFNASNSETNTDGDETEATDSQYFKQIKTLNQGVSDWVQKHVSKDPFVDLSPVFKDYEKHLASIDEKFSLKNPTAADSRTKMINEAPSNDRPSFSGFFSGSPLVTSPTGINGGASLSPVKKPASMQPAGDAATLQEDTPKTDSQVRSSPEDGSFYSTRCKLYFKRATTWAELGVGMLSLKKTNNKIQVLVRNDTVMSKILLNIFLSESTPVSRSERSVLLMSIPNPPVFTKAADGDNTKPVSYLIRVKTLENAVDLHKQMETNTKSP